MRTIVFTVHEPPNAPADRIDRAEQLEFVRDGFVPLAAALPPLWMVLNRLWIALLIYLLASMGLSLGLAMLGMDKSLIALLNMAANIVIGFEASSLRRWTLARRQWAEIGTVVGRNRAECERRFFDGWLNEQPILRRQTGSTGPSSSARPPRLLSTAIGTATAAPVDGEAHFADLPDGATATRPYGGQPSLWRRLLRR